MDPLANCVYCDTPIDRAKMFWILERWEGGRCVARGAVDHPGCLHATGAFQGPREMPPSRCQLHRVVE